MSKSNTTDTLYGNINDTNSLSDDYDDDSSDIKFKNKSQDIQIKKINNIIPKDYYIPLKRNNKRPRLHSMFITGPQIFLEEKEDILMNISKKQRKTSDYSEEDSLSFKTRESIIEWCHNVLNSIKLTETEKKSIFYRFCTAYDFIMEKLFLIHKAIKEEKELKIFIITIFLLTYKLEGFSIAKITISSLIEAFLSEFKIQRKDLIDKISFYEMKIIELIDFNPQIFDDNNIYQLSFLLWDLFNKKYETNFNDKEKDQIEKMINYINKSIQYSDQMIFDIFPIDKAMISFYISVKFYNKDNKDIMTMLENYHDYLKNNMKIIKISDVDLTKYELQLNKQIEYNIGEKK
jgi:hypothetical protein